LLLAVVQTWPEGNEPTDASLMERVLQRDSQALETLYDRYARPVYSLVLRISQQPASAEEIVQDVFLQLWRNAKRYQAARGPLEPWLFTVARNRALDFLRLKRRSSAAARIRPILTFRSPRLSGRTPKARWTNPGERKRSAR